MHKYTARLYNASWMYLRFSPTYALPSETHEQMCSFHAKRASEVLRHTFLLMRWWWIPWEGTLLVCLSLGFVVMDGGRLNTLCELNSSKVLFVRVEETVTCLKGRYSIGNVGKTASMCTYNKDNEWYIYLRNKDTMSQSLPQLGRMTQECALIIMIINGTSTYVTRTPCHKACPNLV